MTSFDLTGPLPLGTTVLEASAGTGKTYAIVGLATRFVAEGVADISQVLLVTFSKGATQELRERTRARFTQVADALSDPNARSHADELVAHLADADAGEVELRRYRLLKALSEFDSGTIATTHSFCQRMLDGLGIAGEREPGAAIVESVDDVVSEVVDDLYLRAYSRVEVDPPVSVTDAQAVCRAAVRDRRAQLSPDEAPEDTAAGQRVAIATAARTETERRKRIRGVRDFDDLLELLHHVLTDPVHGPAACERIRQKFTVVLVDEFQDTDPLQWSILRNAFHGHGVLVLVGDPKQAIYAFRGAEVLSYLDAVRLADRHLVLSTNWRSDAPLVAALSHLYEGAALGHPDIVVGPVGSVHRGHRIDVPALRLRVLPRTGMGPLNKTGFPTVHPVRARVAEDVADDIVALLSGHHTSTTDGSPRPVAPGDVAVLVRTGLQSELVRTALDRVGVPSVLFGGSSVFLTESASHWLRVLHALEQPHRADAVRRAALTPLLGWTARELDEQGDAATSLLSNRLRDWAALFARSGFAALFEALSATTDLQTRLLEIDSGERDLTDLRHLAQLINRETVERGHGLTALNRWLADRIADPTGGTLSDRSRRLDSDAAAVQIATIHSSKGLEFPVVYVPYGWDGAKHPYPSTLLFHDDSGVRVLDVGGKDAAGYAARKQTHEREESGEELRLLYVALTRAQCQVVAWWAPTAGTAASPLHRLLFGRIAGEAEPDARPKVFADGPQWAALTERAAGVITLEPVLGRDGTDAPRIVDASVTGELAAAVFDRRLDWAWRRTSYSAMTAGAHEPAPAATEQEERSTTDEPIDDPVASALGSPEETSALPSPMNGLPAGAAFGTLVHEILEYVDTSAPDLDAEVLRRCVDAVEVDAADLDPARLARALSLVLRTPLGFGTLADFRSEDRLSELDFELPLAGGDGPATASVSVRGIAELVARHLPADDVLAPYADRMAALDDPTLRGYLTGSIDTVLRVGSTGADLRFVVVDYKTNRIAAGDLTVENFTRDRMAEEMMHAHYPLQALLYSVALHRYLRWRLPSYDPSVHLGGVQYHFVRAMAGPRTPPGCGVFDWAPPVALITELSDYLAGRPEAGRDVAGRASS